MLGWSPRHLFISHISDYIRISWDLSTPLEHNHHFWCKFAKNSRKHSILGLLNLFWATSHSDLFGYFLHHIIIILCCWPVVHLTSAHFVQLREYLSKFHKLHWYIYSFCFNTHPFLVILNRLGNDDTCNQSTTGLFMCAICQTDLAASEGISVHAGSIFSTSSKPWQGPFLCADCRNKKDAMEGKIPSGVKVV